MLSKYRCLLEWRNRAAEEGIPPECLEWGKWDALEKLQFNRPSQETYESVEVITIRFHDCHPPFLEIHENAHFEHKWL